MLGGHEVFHLERLSQLNHHLVHGLKAALAFTASLTIRLTMPSSVLSRISNQGSGELDQSM